MAFFGNKEEKERQKADKEAQKTKELLEKYGLEELDEKDMENLRRIMSEMAGMGFTRLGMSLTVGIKAEDRIQIEFLSALFEQNWIMIRQLDRISKKLDNLGK